MDVPQVAINKILYPTDLSESGRPAFAYAASLANRYHAELTVIHVVEEGPEPPPRLLGYIKEDLWEEIKHRDLEEARRILMERKRDNAAIRQCVDDYCETIQAGVPGEAYVTYEIVVKLGNAVEEIISQAEDGRYDLIVIGSHGLGTLKDAVMGTTTRRVLRRTSIPVLVVRVPEPEA